MQKEFTETQMDELVEMILLLDARARYSEVLGIWSEYFVMVFNEKNTKNKQYTSINKSLSDQVDIVTKRAKESNIEEKSYIDAAEIMAINFIKLIVERAFKFSTYTTNKRLSYICNKLSEESKSTETEIGPLRYILDDLKGGL